MQLPIALIYNYSNCAGQVQQTHTHPSQTLSTSTQHREMLILVAKKVLDDYDVAMMRVSGPHKGCWMMSGPHKGCWTMSGPYKGCWMMSSPHKGCWMIMMLYL